MTEVYLLRHGALAAGSRERFIGQLDLPLAPDGIAQAEVLGEVLREKPIDAIYCSDLARSQQTARIIAGQKAIAIEVRHELREISLGNWEGLSRREVAARFPKDYAARGDDLENYRVAGGESFADCRQRVLTVWEEILRHDGNTVVVGHAGVNRLLLCHLLARPVASLFGIAQDYGCVNVIEHGAQGFCVSLINGRPADLRGGICLAPAPQPQRINP
ncbi:MAG: alpha-ribazole phosphatase [Proteobacteria bacterium]|nr:alpha-ribazole phosphatase [Pseudomonadota bacterium]